MSTATATATEAQIEAFMEAVRAKNPNEPEFLQAVQEVAETVIPFIEKTPSTTKAACLSVLPSRSA